MLREASFPSHSAHCGSPEHVVSRQSSSHHRKPLSSSFSNSHWSSYLAFLLIGITHSFPYMEACCIVFTLLRIGQIVLSYLISLLFRLVGVDRRLILALLCSWGAPGLYFVCFPLGLSLHSLWLWLVIGVPHTLHLEGRMVSQKIDRSWYRLSDIQGSQPLWAASCPSRSQDDVWLSCGLGSKRPALFLMFPHGWCCLWHPCKYWWPSLFPIYRNAEEGFEAASLSWGKK